MILFLTYESFSTKPFKSYKTTTKNYYVYRLQESWIEMFTTTQHFASPICLDQKKKYVSSDMKLPILLLVFTGYPVWGRLINFLIVIKINLICESLKLMIFFVSYRDWWFMWSVMLITWHLCYQQMKKLYLTPEGYVTTFNNHCTTSSVQF